MPKMNKRINLTTVMTQNVETHPGVNGVWRQMGGGKRYNGDTFSPNSDNKETATPHLF